MPYGPMAVFRHTLRSWPSVWVSKPSQLSDKQVNLQLPFELKLVDNVTLPFDLNADPG